MDVAPSPLRGHRRRGLALAVIVSVASLFGLLAVSRQPPERFVTTLLELDAGLVVLALALHVGLWLWWAARLGLLAGAVGVRLPFRDALRAVLAGTFAASITPAMLGGEAVRGYCLARGEKQVGAAGAAILAERLLDMLVFMAGGMAFALLYGRVLQGPLAVALLGAAVLMAFGLGMVTLAWVRPRVVRGWAARVAAQAALKDEAKRARWRDRAEREFDHFRASLGVLARRRALLAAALACTALMWACEMGVLWSLLQAFGTPLPFPLVLLAGMLLLLAMTTPLVPGGSGIAELGAAAIFGMLVPGLSPLFAAAWRGCTFYLNLAVGGWAAARLWPRQDTVSVVGPTAPEVAR